MWPARADPCAPIPKYPRCARSPDRSTGSGTPWPACHDRLSRARINVAAADRFHGRTAPYMRIYNAGCLLGRGRKLRLHKFSEKATAALELVKCAGLGDTALAKNQDAIGITDRRQPMRDDKGRAALHHLIERETDPLLGEWIERARRLIQNENRRILE